MAEDTLYEPVVRIQVDDKALADGLKRAEDKAKQSAKKINDAMSGRGGSVMSGARSAMSSFGSVIGQASKTSATLASTIGKMSLGVGAAVIAARPLADLFTRTSATVEGINAQMRQMVTHTQQVKSIMESVITLKEKSAVTIAGYRTEGAVATSPSWLQHQTSIFGQDKAERIEAKNAKSQLRRSMQGQLEAMNANAIDMGAYARDHGGRWGDFKSLFIGNDAYLTNSSAIASYDEEEAARKRSNSRFIEKQEAAMNKQLDEQEAARQQLRMNQVHAVRRERNRDVAYSSLMSMFDLARNRQLQGDNPFGAQVVDIAKNTFAGVSGNVMSGQFRSAWNNLLGGVSQFSTAGRAASFAQTSKIADLQSGLKIAGLTARNDLYGSNDYAIELERIEQRYRREKKETARIIQNTTSESERAYAKQAEAAIKSTEAMEKAEAKKQELLRKTRLQLSQFESWGTGVMSDYHGSGGIRGAYLDAENKPQLSVLTADEMRSHNRRMEKNTSPAPVVDGRDRRN